MGGTFNPIHYGHLVTAEVVRDRFKLDKIIFVPSHRTPYKGRRDLTSSSHRYKMAKLAIENNEYFSVSDIEIKRGGKSYTRDTMEEFKRRFGKETRLFFITGADAIAQMPGWKRAKELSTLCEFIAASRPGFKLKRLPPEYQRHTHLIEVPALAISSTDIRRRLKKGKTIKYLLPAKVERYIYHHRLYLKASKFK
jgi:nicotinate-nucleotide adenylyltransferase